MESDSMFSQDWAEILARKRIRARRKRRLTYDCMNSTPQLGEVVRCKKGHEFPAIGRSEMGGLSLRSVLSGRSSSVCQKCKDFDQETDE